MAAAVLRQREVSMRRIAMNPRSDWRAKCEELGFSFYGASSEEGQPYWRETVAYEFTIEEITRIEQATKELFDRCMDAVDYIIAHERYEEFMIPKAFWPAIKQSWDQDDPTVYGRFDLALQADGTPKMLEFNADTPTSLLETSAVQWHWMKDIFGEKADQFNSVHEQLIEQWRHIRTQRWRLPEGAPLYMSSLHDGGDGKLIVEDYENVAYMAETAKAAGFSPRQIYIEDIVYDAETKQFIDGAGRPIRHIFKLYPWEWMAREAFAEHILEAGSSTVWIEPLWKMLLSNKQLLTVLWELFPNHPNLLPAYTSADNLNGQAVVRKPKLGREGANVTIFREDGTIQEESPGGYGAEGYVWQAFSPLSSHDGMQAVIGSWVVGDTPAGIDVRETSGSITGNLAFFVPHYIKV